MGNIDLKWERPVNGRTSRAPFGSRSNVIKALSLAPDVAGAHMILALVYILTNRAPKALPNAQALTLNRNLAYADGAIGLAKFYMGRPTETEGHVIEAFRLSPRDNGAYRMMRFVGVAKLQLGADAEAVDWLRRSIKANRTNPSPIFCSPLPWACLARRTRREPLRKRDLRSIQALPPPLARRQNKRQSNLSRWTRAPL